MKKSIDLCHKCNSELQKVQQKYNEKYYLGLQCSRCKNVVFEMPIVTKSSPWKDVLEVTNIGAKVMKGVERLSRQL